MEAERTPALAGRTGSACAHREQPVMGYAQWHEDADRRLAAGERQHRCRACGLYIWSEFWKSPNSEVSDGASRTIDEPPQSTSSDTATSAI